MPLLKEQAVPVADKKKLDRPKIGVYTPIMLSHRSRSELVKCFDCACFNIRKASRAVTQLFDGMLQPSGLRSTQFTLLVVLSHAGPITITRLGQTLVMDRTTLTRNLKPLANQELVKIGPGKDQRTRVVALTPRGQGALAMAFPLWEKAQASVIKRLGRERWSSLLADLSATVALARAG